MASILADDSAMNQSQYNSVINLTTVLYCDWFFVLSCAGMKTECS